MKLGRWDADAWAWGALCVEECVQFPFFQSEPCGCSHNDIDMICEGELCFNSTDLCNSPPDNCEHLQIANEGSECLCSPIDKVCLDGEYCDLLADDCLNITAAPFCRAFPEISDEICNCEDNFACKPGYMCREGSCIERPDPCPERPYVNTGREDCWCKGASDFCAFGQMCDDQCSDPPPDCAQAPLSPDSSCVCSWRKEKEEKAKVRRLLTGELVGTWDGTTMTPVDEDQTPLTLQSDGSTILEGNQPFGILKDLMIFKTVDWVRLSEYPRGRIELFKDGQWGTLCSHYWSASKI